jgi:hypothetical protein
MLFGGAVPPNGFWVQSPYANFWINDHGPPTYNPTTGLGTGFSGSNPFTTPGGYKPMGPVSMLTYNCTGTVYINARAW